MPSKLDLTWQPSSGQDTPPVGKAPALYRDDTYTHTIRVTDGALNHFDDWTWTAQIRQSRLRAGVTVAVALASFAITLETDGDDLLVHLSLSRATTLALALPADGYWDLQLALAGVNATWLAGKVKLLDDVSRAA